MKEVKAPQTASGSSISLEASSWPGGIVPAPLLPGEDGAGYAKFTAQFLAATQPGDFIEEILVRDAIDLSWEILRLRRLKAGLLRAAASEGVDRILSTIGKKDFIRSFGEPDFAEKWASGDSGTRREFTEMLKKAGLTMDEVMGEALAKKIETFERVDRIVAGSEARRNNALREIDRHREALGAAMRRTIDEVEDAEFRDLETGEVSQGPPS